MLRGRRLEIDKLGLFAAIWSLFRLVLLLWGCLRCRELTALTFDKARRGRLRYQLHRALLRLTLRILPDSLLEGDRRGSYLLLPLLVLPLEELCEENLPVDDVQFQVVVHSHLVRGFRRRQLQLIKDLLQLVDALFPDAICDTFLVIQNLDFQVFVFLSFFLMKPVLLFSLDLTVLVDEAVVLEWLQLLLRLHQGLVQLRAVDRHFTFDRVEAFGCDGCEILALLRELSLFTNVVEHAAIILRF